MNKKHIIITAIVVIFAFIFGYFANNDTTVDNVNKQISTKVSNEPTQIEDKQTTEVKEEKSEIIKFGEDGVVSGNWIIKILDVKEATTIDSGSPNFLKLQTKNLLL